MKAVSQRHNCSDTSYEGHRAGLAHRVTCTLYQPHLQPW